MTPEQEDALIEIALSQVPKDSSDPWADHVRLAIRAAYAQGNTDGVAAERERCAKVCEREADGWHLACEANLRDASRGCAAAIRRGE